MEDIENLINQIAFNMVYTLEKADNHIKINPKFTRELENLIRDHISVEIG